jgi:hypothetical protein
MEDFNMTARKKDKNETKEPVGIDVEELTELQEGTDAFQSYGYSYIKVTRNGETKALKIPIKSSGVTELIEEWKKNEPKPPVIDVLVTPDSEAGKQMKLREKRWCKMPNLSDEKYVEALDRYQSDLGMAIAQKGLALKMKDKEGNEITDPAQKTQLLKRMGMSGSQFSQMVNDIRIMTEWSEEELVSFFGMSLAEPME